MQGQLQCSDPTVPQRKKHRCYKITRHLGKETMFLLQTRVRFTQTTTTHLSAAIYNIVTISVCPHCNSPGVPHAAAQITGQKISMHLNHTQKNPNTCGKESRNRKYQAGKPKAWVGTLSCQPSHFCWETSGKHRDRKVTQVNFKAP